MKLSNLAFTGLLLVLPCSIRAEVKPSRIFSDNMVLQRDCPVPVWGTADPGEEVTVAFGGQTKTTKADADGRWMLKLDPLKANTQPGELKIGTSTKTNILVGDVWICSGQSNMEFPLRACNPVEEDIKAADLPDIRRIKFELRVARKPVEEVTAQWEICTPQTAPNFTAVGFYFARRIQNETGVPIGLIDSNWGGTRIEPWTPPCGFELEPSLAPLKDGLKSAEQRYREFLLSYMDDSKLVEMEKWIADFKKAKATPGMEIPFPPDNLQGESFNGQPTSIYNAMIAPVVPFPIKGVIWYQGEGNAGQPMDRNVEESDAYYTKMRALIGGWRKVWNQGDFPFYFVQIANYFKSTDNPASDDGWARLRMSQLKSLQIPNTGMAVAIDNAEDPNNVHPANKFDIGERLALWALAKDYGRKDLVFSGPLYKSMKIEGAKIRVEFDSVGSGLMVATKAGRNATVEDKGGKLKRFAIAGEDKKWVWADALIDGNAVVVSSPEVPNPVAVRYAFACNPAGANLYNKDGLPASPFRTDDWK